MTVGQARSFEADRGLRVRFEAKQPEGIEPGRRRVEADLWQIDLPAFLGPFHYWKLASDFAAMPQDLLNAAGVC